MGAAMSAQVRLDTVVVAAGRFPASPDIGLRSPVTGRPCVCCRLRHRGFNRLEVDGTTEDRCHFCRDETLQFWAAELRRAFTRR